MSGLNIEDLVQRSIYILREAHAQYPEDKTIELCSWGKDSITTLSLVREAFMGSFPWKVVHIDTRKKFKEMYEFRDKLQKEWGFDLEIISSDAQAIEDDKLECCNALKTEPLKKYIKDNGIKAVIVSIRRDEHYIRNIERYMSPRYEGHWLTFDAEKWDKKIKELKEKFGDDERGFQDAVASIQFNESASLQDVELEGWGLLESDFGKADHVRVHPLLHWGEEQVWRYIKDRNIPFNPLYRADYCKKAYGWENKRMRSLGCQPCTFPVDSTASTIDEIIEELRTTDVEERSGRLNTKEERMNKLRALGYLIIAPPILFSLYDAFKRGVTTILS